MKKMLRTGKKALSVIMAIMMVLTAWVWVAPTEAEAATAGNYKVRITWQNNNTKKYSNQFTGTETEQGARAGIILYYKSNNGTGTESKVYWDIGWNNDSGKGAVHGTYVSATKSTGWTNSSTGTDYTCEATIAGFPTVLFAMADSDNITDKGIYTVKKLEVYSNADSSWKTLWAGDGYLNTSTEYKFIKITADGDGTISWNGTKDGNGDVTTTTETWNFPTPTTATTWSGVSAMTVPKTGTATQDIELVVNDQYGVEMFNPTWSVKGSVCGTTGISVDPATSSQTTTIKLTNAANVSSSTDTQTGTITATWGTLGSLSETFTITDSYYTATFNYKSSAGADTSTKKYGYHGDTITAPSAPEYDSGDYHYVFSKWSPTFASTITKDVIYTAQYTSSFVDADYSGVNEAIAAADAIKANYGTEYELKYTLASRVALDNAIDAVVTGLGRTQQDVVDGYAQAINDAIAALDPNKFDVIFLDKNGAILLYEKDVEYKEAVTAPSFPDDQKVYFDSTNHYTFTGWDTDEYTSVVDDLVIQPVFTAEAHTFTTSTVTSNCVTKGATKYTCSCGYSYVDGETDYGDHVWEADYTTDLEPTCTVAGSKSIHCSLCDAQKDITVISPLGHNWATQSVAVEATCGKIGIATKVCDDCLVCEHTIIPALEHDYKKTTVAPTCTAKGYDEYVCQNANCGHSYRDNYTDVVAHTYGAWETVSEAHCEVEGVKKQTCTKCGFVNLGSIDALQHNLSAWTDVVERTCTGKGYQVKTCSLCNNVIEEQWLDALGHNYVTKTVVAPTCTAKGYTIEECNRDNCGAERVVNETAALGHGWTSTTHEADCTHSAYIEHVCANDSTHNYIEYVSGSTALTHDFTGTETIIGSATCEADGKKYVQCSRCDETTEVIIPKLGHSYGEWDKTPATNDTDGTWTRECAKCGDVETITIPKGDHNLVEDTTQYVAPKCNAKGQQVYKCTNHTDCTVTVTVELDYAQHTIKQRETKATCTQKGSVEAYCSVCNTSFETTETPVKAHNPVAGTPVAATCTSSGYTPYACACGTFSYKEYNGNALGHDFSGEATVVDATCTAEGSKTVKCSRCTETYTTTLPKVNHKYSAVGEATEATCASPSTQAYECDYCADTYTEFVEAAKGHTYGNWTVVQEATADSYGIEKRVCSVCGDADHTTTAPTGAHDFEKASEEAATCENEGSIEWVCKTHTDCEANYTETLDKLAHTQEITYTAPTCIAEGSTKVVCSACGAEILSETISATGIHNFDVAGTVTTDPTCTGEGTMTYTCKVDGCTATKTETIPAKGHDLSTTVTDATCGTKGSVVTECTVCKDATVKTTTELAAKGHIWKDTPESTKAAKCETDGSETYKCQNCDAENVVVLPMLGHDWGEWTVTPSTNDAPGSVSRKCSTCNETETVEIPAGGHKLVVDTDNSTDASCSAEGTLVYKCENHTDCGITVTVTTAKLQHAVTQRELEATCKAEGKVEAYCSICNTVLSTETIPVKAHAYTAGTPVDATCTTSGYTPYTCSCGDTYNKYDESKPATGHDFDETVEGNVTTSPATCTADGSKTVKCKNCDAKNTVVLPKKGHSYVENTTKATSATCTALATKTYECSCGASYTEYVGTLAAHQFDELVKTVPATNDSLGYEERKCDCGLVEITIIEATGTHVFAEKVVDECVAPTCTENGTDVYKCTAHTDCGAKSSVLVPRLGHTVTAVYNAPTCVAKGSSDAYCETCKTTISSVEIPAKGHAYNTVSVTKEAECEATGIRTYTCACGDEYTETIPMKGHSLSTTVNDATCGNAGSVVTTCSACSYSVTEALAAKGHIWKDAPESTVKADCVNNGSETYKCQNCDAENVVVLPMLGHDWGEWSVTKASTNTEKGEMTRTCSRGCTETVEIPAGDHNLVVDTANSTDASCSAEGTLVYKCKNHTDCGITVTVTTAKLQHELEITKEDAKCENEGTVVTKCKNCDTETHTTTIPATGHTYDDGVKTDATCTAEGKIVYSCKDCTYTKEVTLEKLQHNYVAGTPVDATCTTSGYTPYKCATCESNYVIITASANGHTYVKDTSTATCTAGGKMTLKCACGDTMETEVPALGHDYQLDSTTAATCAAAATETYKCSRCTASYTVSVGSKTTSHDWNDWVTVENATNTSLGYKTRICKVCDKLEVETIPATGEHVYDILVSEKAASCESAGEKVYSCSTHPGETGCKLTSTITIPATGHTESLSYKAATCTDAGYAKRVCTVVGCEKVLEEKEIPALEHNWINEKVTLSTCSATGKVEFNCSRCTETKTVEIPVNSDAHKLVKTTTAVATCAAEGEITITCQNGCNYEETVAVPKTEHTWNDWTVTKAATNTEKGTLTRTCSNGLCTETAEIPAGGHSFDTSAPASTKNATCKVQGTATYNCSAHADCGITITVNTGYAAHTYDTKTEDATCTKEGSVKTYCTACNDVFTEVTLTKLQHVFEEVSTTDPTCTKSGYITYKCETCDKSYDEINGDAKGHTLKETVTNGNCTKDGTAVLSCDDCDYEVTVSIPKTGHNYVLIGTTDASCKSAATETYKCLYCDASYTDYVGDKTTNHSYPDSWTVVKEADFTSIGYKTRTCTVCGQLEVQTIEATGEHKFEDGDIVDTVAATCTENGYVERKCSVHTDCGKTAQITIPATGHTEVAINATTATCDASGSSAGSECSACGTVLVAPVTLPALGCDWVIEKVDAATCVAAGTVYYTCSRGCGEKHTETIAIDDDAHKYVTTVTQATCTDDGTVTTKCSLCSDTKTETISAKGHVWNDTASSTEAATCEDTGLATYKCKYCTAEHQETIPALGHIYTEGTKVAPTCTSSGYTVYTCKNDTSHKYNVYDENEPAIAHNYAQVEGSSTATCTSGGEVALKCADCGKEIKTAVPALGHEWGTWTITKNPTASAEGEKERKCSKCNATETVNLPVLGHVMEKDTGASTAPTCTLTGKDVYVCTSHTGEAACGYTYEVVVPVVAHSYSDEKITTEATCETEGVKTLTCACGATKTEVVPKLGHILSTSVEESTCQTKGSVTTKCDRDGCKYELVTELALAPHDVTVTIEDATCTAKGKVTEKCADCSYEKTTEIPALGHDYDDSISDNVNITEAATCTKEGKKTVKCSRCDSKRVVNVAKLSHKFSIQEEHEATCTESGYNVMKCDTCTETYNEFVSNPTGHSWGSGEITTEATCTTDGVRTFTCANCSEKKTEAINKFGHSWGAWYVAVAPTATADGIQQRDCLREGCNAFETGLIPALGGTTTYTVTFVADGKVIATQTVNHGGSATAPVISKASDADYHYSYTWDTDFRRVTKDLTVTAVFTPVAHTYGEWITDINPGCDSDGRRHRLCTADGCGYAQYETVEKTEHDFRVIGSKAATCTDNGFKDVICNNCGYSEHQIIKRLGHVLSYHESVEATCNTDGLEAHYSCSRCGKFYKDKGGKTELTNVVISMKNHTFLVIEGTEATCTKDGSTDYRYCASCGLTMYSETIPATGHADTNGDNTCDKCGATYMENGSIVCSCSCHKNGFFNEIIYKILSFFWKLFGTNKSCECGKVHY